MSNPLIVELRLEGSIPSKKNSRINTRDGLSFPSKDFSNWQKSALTQVRMQTKHRFFKPVSLEVIVYFATDARADLDNKLTSILDMLVEGMVLRDDKWQEVPMISVQAAYRPKKAGAFIRLTELPADVMGAELEAVRAKRRPRNKLMVK
jgi:Holliday junction resolvase RusA-like endonuclease